MKLKNYFIAFATIAIAAGFSSCKKDSSSGTSGSNTAEAQAQSIDQTQYTNETDGVTNDVNAAVDIYGGSINERVSGITTPPLPTPCNATIKVDTMSATHSITIVYNGNNCFSTSTRTGTVAISFSPGFKWSSPGAELTVTFNNFKATHLSDNKSILINGTRTITNVSGGLLRNLASLPSVVQKVTDANVSVTFDNTAARTWQNTSTRTFTYNNGIDISFTGSGSGVNRFGHSFNYSITQPLVVKSSCSFRVTSGEVQNTGSLVTTTTTFGLDSNGTAVSDCPSALYYKIVWTGPQGNSISYIGGY
ncbi:MAG: hypothetical protein ABI863_10940 [Ginsengibacter sp.]